MRATLIQNHNSERGAILVFVVALLSLIGVAILLGVDDFAIARVEDRERTTRKEMEVVSSMLAAYVQRYDRLPCPANPATATDNITPGTGFGYEDLNPGALPLDNTDDTCNRLEGVLPFRTLQIPESLARDAWASYYTYAVSRAAAQSRPAQVFGRCSSANWWQTLAGFDYHLNPPKASFCCPGNLVAVADDLVVSSDGTLPNRLEPPGDRTYVPPATSALTADIATPGGPYAGAFGGPASARVAAYVLVSHGRSPGGAFAVDGTTNPIPGVGGRDAENSDNDRTFTASHQVLAPGANSFDDIVVYKSQYQIYSQLSGGTCARPWR